MSSVGQRLFDIKEAGEFVRIMIIVSGSWFAKIADTTPMDVLKPEKRRHTNVRNVDVSVRKKMTVKPDVHVKKKMTVKGDTVGFSKK